MAFPLEGALAGFCHETDFDSLPADVQERASVLLVDALANAIAGRAAQRTPVVEEAMFLLCGGGDSVVVAGGTTSPTAAALTNGFQITSYTMCDVYRPALCHITPEVVPPLLEVLRTRPSDGRALLAAFAVGLEVTTRLGRGVDYTRFRRRGWHAPGVIGPFGAVAALGSLLRLDEETLRGAFGLALSQAGGTFAALGTPAVKFHQGRGAVAGLWATDFAQRGLGGAQAALSDPDGGLLAAYADSGKPQLITEGLSSDWELMRISMRRWPAASSLQSLVEAALDLRRRELEPGHVRRLTVALPPTSYTMCAEMAWDDELTAMQSARYVASVVFHKGSCWIEQFDEAHRADGTVAHFARTSVDVFEDAELPATGVELTAHMQDGQSIRLRIETPLGDPARPLSSEQVQQKLAEALGGHPSVRDPGALNDLLASVPEIGDSSSLVAALHGPSGDSRSWRS